MVWTKIGPLGDVFKTLCADWEVWRTRYLVPIYFVINNTFFLDVSCTSKRPIIFQNCFKIFKKSKCSIGTDYSNFINWFNFRFLIFNFNFQFYFSIFVSVKIWKLKNKLKIEIWQFSIQFYILSKHWLKFEWTLGTRTIIGIKINLLQHYNFVSIKNWVTFLNFAIFEFWPYYLLENWIFKNWKSRTELKIGQNSIFKIWK